MKKLTAAMIILMLVSTACKKETLVAPVAEHPVMRYTELNNLELKSWTLKSIDIDGDAIRDFSFEAFPLGDPVLQQDKIIFNAYSTIHTSFLSDPLDNPPLLEKGESVKPVHPGYEWWPITASTLAKKIIPVSGTPYWEGIYKNAFKKYLPLLIIKNELKYYGWLEITIDQQSEKLIVHRAGLSTEAGKVVKAGF